MHTTPPFVGRQFLDLLVNLLPDLLAGRIPSIMFKIDDAGLKIEGDASFVAFVFTVGVLLWLWRRSTLAARQRTGVLERRDGGV